MARRGDKVRYAYRAGDIETATIRTGSFTPTLTFATPGDLTPAYTTQLGTYWRLGPIVFFDYTLVATPTWTTAAGNLQLGGLPFAAANVTDQRWAFIGRVAGTGITWPGGRTNSLFFLSEGNDYLLFQVNGSAATTASVTAADMTTATAVNFRTSGFYITDED